MLRLWKKWRVELVVPIGIVLLSCPILLIAAPRLHTVTNDFLKKAIVRPPVESVGLLAIKTDQGPPYYFQSQKIDRIYYSGFFIDEDLFVTAQVPENDQFVGRVASLNPTYVFHGGLHIAPDFDFERVRPNFAAVEVLNQSPGFGFIVMKVIKIDDGEAVPKPLPLLTEELAEEIKLQWQYDPFYILGYEWQGSGDQAGATLKFAEGCRIIPQRPQFAEDKFVGTPSELRALKAALNTWVLITCPYREGFKGAPVLVRHEGKWYAAGIVVPAAEEKSPQEKDDNDQSAQKIPFPKMTSLTDFFGIHLIGEEK